MDPHRIHKDLYDSPHSLPDPGHGGKIRVTGDLLICEMESGGSGETRTLVAPTKPGIRFALRLMADGGGDVVVTAENGFNSLGETVATFADASDLLDMVSVEYSAPSVGSPATYRWAVAEGNTGVSISA